MKAVVSLFSEGRERYDLGSQRLVQSLIDRNFDGDIIIFSPTFVGNSVTMTPNGHKLFNLSGWGWCGNKSHEQAPYQFKSNVIEDMRQEGYDQVAWLDSSVVVINDPTDHFNLAQKNGVVLYDNLDGNTEDIWTSDKCLNNLGCNAQLAKNILQIDAAMMIFDFRKEIACSFLKDYGRYCRDINNLLDTGSNRPEFKAHRHDQSIASFLKHKYGIKTLQYGEAWTYFFDIEKGNNKNAIFSKTGCDVPLSDVYKELK